MKGIEMFNGGFGDHRGSGDGGSKGGGGKGLY